MSTTTTNLSLTKPDTSDLALIGDINTNMDTIDALTTSSSPTTAAMSDSPNAGTLTRLAYSDHRHGMPGFGTPVAVGTSNSSGSATTVARSDHVHQAATVYVNHGPETFDINAGTTEDIRVYVPSTPSSATLILRGRALVAGLVGAHTHSVTSNVTATTNSTGGESLTSGAGSAHGHAGSTAANESSHTHTISAGSAHNHSVTAGGNHNHALQVNAASGDPLDLDIGGTPSSNNSQIAAASDHDHGGSVGNESSHTHTTTAAVAHTHTLTIANESSHTHSVATSNHSHTVTVTNNAVTSGSTGSGGFTATSRPATVTVTIDGTDRTAALGGGSGFGSAGVDWNEQSLNILTYISSTGWHTIEFSAGTGGRLKAQVLLAL